MISISARWARVALMLTLGLGACSKKPSASAAQDTAAPPEVAATQAAEPVPTILTIRCAINKSDPPQLVVDVGGEVPTLGWTNPVLTPRIYVAPPANGIWEYDFTALRPTGMVPQVITPIAASHTWPDYPEADLKGVKVYGVGAGVKESTIRECFTS